MHDAPDEVLPLLADARRWRLLVELVQGDLRVHELVARVGSPQNLVSYHLRQLRDAGLVSARRSTADGRDTYYRLEVAEIARRLASVGAALHPGLRVSIEAPVLAPRRRGHPSVLFLCTGNSARSQIAEALLRHRSAGTVHARSAGSHPKPLHPLAVQVLAERGIDASGATAKHHRRFARSRFDQVVTLCDRIREVCPALPGDPIVSHWSTPDPALVGGAGHDPYPAFVRTADELDGRIGVLLAQLAPHQPAPHQPAPHQPTTHQEEPRG